MCSGVVLVRRGGGRNDRLGFLLLCDVIESLRRTKVRGPVGVIEERDLGMHALGE